MPSAVLLNNVPLIIDILILLRNPQVSNSPHKDHLLHSNQYRNADMSIIDAVKLTVNTSNAIQMSLPNTLVNRIVDSTVIIDDFKITNPK